MGMQTIQVLSNNTDMEPADVIDVLLNVGEQALHVDGADQIMLSYGYYSSRILRFPQAHQRQEVPIFSGGVVYFLMRGDIVVYVGMSTRLLSRINDHAANKDFDSIAYIKVDGVELAMVEDFNIEHHQPELNVRRPTKKDLLAAVAKEVYSNGLT